MKPQPPPTTITAKPDFDPAVEAVATSWLAQNRGKPQWAGPPSLSRVVTSIIPYAERKAGFGVRDLQTRWAEIVGEKIASISQPDSLKGETLTIKVAAAAAPLLGMRSAEIIGLVRLAGATKVKRLSMIRAPLRAPTSANSPRQKRPLNASEQRKLDQQLEQVSQPSLKAALMRLAEATSDID